MRRLLVAWGILALVAVTILFIYDGVREVRVMQRARGVRTSPYLTFSQKAKSHVPAYLILGSVGVFLFVTAAAMKPKTQGENKSENKAVSKPTPVPQQLIDAVHAATRTNYTHPNTTDKWVTVVRLDSKSGRRLFDVKLRPGTNFGSRGHVEGLEPDEILIFGDGNAFAAPTSIIRNTSRS